MDNATQKQELNDLELKCNILEKVVVQQKQKALEMQDFMMNLAKQGGPEGLRDVVSYNQDLKKQCKDLTESLYRVQFENENLTSKVAELNDLTFTPSGQIGGYISTGPKGGSVNFDNASSIGRDSDDEDRIGEILIVSNEQVSQLQQQVATLEDEIVVYRKQIEKQKKNEQKSLDQSSTIQEQVNEDLVHIKSIFIQFLQSIPLGSKGDQLVPIL